MTRSRVCRSGSFVAVAISVLIACGPASGSEDWPRYAGPGGQWQVDLGAWTDAELPWTELWKRSHEGGHAGIVAKQGVAYLFVRRDGKEVLEAVDVDTGTVRWTVADPAAVPSYAAPSYGVGPNSTPALSEEFVITLGSWGRLQARRRADGERVWQRDLIGELGGSTLERGLAASPLILGGLIVVPVGGEGQAVVAFELATGAQAWSAHSDTAAYATAQRAEIGGVEQIVALLQNSLVGLRPASGEVLWEIAIDSRRYAITSTPIVVGSSVATVTARDGTRIDVKREGEDWQAVESWTDAAIGSQVANSVLRGGLWLGTRGTSGANFWTAVDWRSGEVVWRSRDVGNARVLAGPGGLLLLTEDGELVLAQASRDGLEVQRREPVLMHRSWTPPSLADGVLIVRSEREIVALSAVGSASSKGKGSDRR